MQLIDRYRGALVGVHVGDSLGAPYETWESKEIVADLKARGGLTFFDYPNPWVKDNDGNGAMLPQGRPTDDSDQTADLAYSLTTDGGLDSAHLREALQNSVYRHVSRLWDGKAIGSGGTTRDALCDDPVRNHKARCNNIGTNGSLMRASPMALWFGPPESWTADSYHHYNLVERMSVVTHHHPHSVQACWMYTKILCLILGGERNPLDGFKAENKLEQRVMASLTDEFYFPFDPGRWPMRGSAEFSLIVALYAFLHSSSFAEGVERAIVVGGDTDTYGAIAGGLLGACYGYEGIPSEWRSTILGHDQMVGYADSLYRMRVHQ